MHDHFARLIKIRREHDALTARGGFALDAVHDEEGWALYHRWTEGGDVVCVAVNFAAEPRTIRGSLPQPGQWKDLLSKRTFTTGPDNKAEIALGPAEAVILVRPS